ncbi:hypothetical protein [Microbacterium sp. MYb64]|uniref:hypothetical protein n=1 Tax=Microbacterium sp. MYb64 TaxID=1848691 RepID=UPI000CFB309C|nr:hypothetical protein [Microbacterium sp. MYb64]PRB00843.1 hypothetical protein CQ044_18015 [Microbacterium sp. MYb64]
MTQHQGESFGKTPDSTRRTVPRRTIIKGAAWSIPVVAAAAALPTAAASCAGSSPWDIGIVGGCMINFWGAGKGLPGFTVTSAGSKGANNCCSAENPPSALSIDETAQGVWSVELPDLGGLLYAAWNVAPIGGVALSAPFIAWALAYATAIVAELAIPAALAGYGPYVSGPNWIAPTSVSDFLNFSVTPQKVGSGFNQRFRVNCTFTLKRTLTLAGMPSCSQTGWGYLGGVVMPDPTANALWQALVQIPLLGSALNSAAGTIAPVLTLTATGNWSDADNSNNVGVIGNNLLTPGHCA